MKTLEISLAPGLELKAFIEQKVELEEGAWDALQKQIRVKRLPRKAHFQRQGEVCKYLGFLVKGYVRLYYLVDGKEITKDFNFENAFCGSYESFSSEMPARFNVIAMEDTELYLLERNSLYALFDEYPGLQKFARLCMECMFIRKEHREASFLLDSAEKRYNDLLLQQPDIVKRVPLKYLASYLGIAPETISRIRRLV